MSQPKILVLCSHYYKELAAKQLASCLALLNASRYDYVVETVEAGTYEIPAAILNFHRNQPFDGYISLGLLLKGSTDHYDFIMQHVRECFIKLAMDGVLIGDGNVYAPTMDLLISRVENAERVQEAFDAVDYLIRLKEKLKKGN
jgi:6,7-dimethyl-8-ribityllumazine synthase